MGGLAQTLRAADGILMVQEGNACPYRSNGTVEELIRSEGFLTTVDLLGGFKLIDCFGRRHALSQYDLRVFSDCREHSIGNGLPSLLT
jgi:hypothetical protein